MAWTREKTIKIFILVFLLSLIFAVIAIACTIFNLMKAKKGDNWTSSFLYLLGTTFGTGLGCLWFRIFHSKMTWSHAILHIISFVLMVAGHREIFTLFGSMDKLTNKYTISLLAIVVYLLQFLLSFHLVIIRYGRSPAQKAFRSGLHAFIGALTFFICVTDGLLVCHRIGRDGDYSREPLSDLACFSILGYGICTWYLFLNPYFDWRRLMSLHKSRPTFLLSFHLVIIRYGRSPSSKAFRIGFHSFFGALMFFICVTDGIVAWHSLIRDTNYDRHWIGSLTGFCIMGYAICTWYLILNVRLDWRRLCALHREGRSSYTQKSKDEIYQVMTLAQITAHKS